MLHINTHIAPSLPLTLPRSICSLCVSPRNQKRKTGPLGLELRERGRQHKLVHFSRSTRFKMPRSRCYAASPTPLPPSISSASILESEGEDRTSQSVESRKREVAQASTPVNKHKVHNASRSGHIVTNQYPHRSPTLPPQCQSSKSGGED